MSTRERPARAWAEQSGRPVRSFIEGASGERGTLVDAFSTYGNFDVAPLLTRVQDRSGTGLAH